MSEGTSEKGKGISRRGFLAMLGLGVAALAGADRIGGAKSDLTNAENLKRYLQSPELFPHTNYQGEVTLTEGTEIFREPRMSKSEEVGGIATTKVGSETSIGVLGQGESVRVKDPFLFLTEADQFTDPAWIREIEGPEGKVKKANLLRSWIIFDTHGKTLPASIKSVSEYKVACVSAQNLGLDYQKLNFSQEIKFGSIT
jgi:hypothetical protein